MGRQKIIHIHSSVLNQLPTKDNLEYGEIAVNYSSENPLLSIKDSKDAIVKFS